MKRKKQKLLRQLSRILIVLVILGALYFIFDDFILIDRIESTGNYDQLNNYEIINKAEEKGLHTVSDFQEKYQKSVVLFTTTWCSACEYLSTIMLERAELYPNIQFYQIDIDSNRTLAENLDVYIAPTLVMIDEINAAYESGIEREDIVNDLHFFSIVGVSNLPISYKNIDRDKF